MSYKTFIGKAYLSVYKYFSSFFQDFFKQRENVHGSMAYLTLLVTLAMQIYVTFSGANVMYFLEILITNYSFILALLGIRGYFNIREYTISATNGNKKDKSHELQ